MWKACGCHGDTKEGHTVWPVLQMLHVQQRAVKSTQDIHRGDPAVVQQDKQRLGSVGMQVQSLGWHSGLRIWHCCSCGLGRICGLDLIPGLGIPYATGQWKKYTYLYPQRLSWLCSFLLFLSLFFFAHFWYAQILVTTAQLNTTNPSMTQVYIPVTKAY